MTDFKAAGCGGPAYARVVSASCIFVLCIILIAGLWPLHVPTNEVSWLKNQDGLLFGRYGSVVSTSTFRGNDSKDHSSCSLEIWLAPTRIDNTKTILSFEGSAHPGNPFSLHQDKDGLHIERPNVDTKGISRTAWIKVDGVFHENNPVFVTITLRKEDTSVYLDGVLAKVSPILGISTSNFTGRLVIADSATAHDSWPGRILGLGIYQSWLTPAKVAQHYESWTRTRRPALAEDEAPVALYLFNEGKGKVVHNQLDPATDLIIPSHYFVLHPGFLVAPWREYKPTWSYWQDFVINIAGFVPLGVCLAAYFSSVHVTSWPRVTTIVLGFAVSLTIEVLQAFLPTRSSGVTDLLTNSLGTAIGVIFYSVSFTQTLLSKSRDNLANCLEDSSRVNASSSTSVSV
jgi:VanZ family protein